MRLFIIRSLLGALQLFSLFSAFTGLTTVVNVYVLYRGLCKKLLDKGEYIIFLRQEINGYKIVRKTLDIHT